MSWQVHVPREQPVDVRERAPVLGTALHHTYIHAIHELAKSFNEFNGASHSMSLSELLDWSAQEAAFTPARSERFQTPPPTQVQVADDEDGWRLSAA